MIHVASRTINTAGSSNANSVVLTAKASFVPVTRSSVLSAATCSFLGRRRDGCRNSGGGRARRARAEARARPGRVVSRHRHLKDAQVELARRIGRVRRVLVRREPVREHDERYEHGERADAVGRVPRVAGERGVAPPEAGARAVVLTSTALHLQLRVCGRLGLISSAIKLCRFIRSGEMRRAWDIQSRPRRRHVPKRSL